MTYKIGELPEAKDLKRYVDNRIQWFEGELNPDSTDTKNEAIRARIVELRNFKIIVDAFSVREVSA